GLVTGVGDPELVDSGEHVTGRLRQGVEALQLEVGEAGMDADVETVVLGEAVAGPDPEVAELREEARVGAGDERVAAEAVGDVAVTDVDTFEVEAEPVVDLEGV